MARRVMTLAIAFLLMLVGCGGAGEDVDWDNYDPSVKQRIDSMAEKQDCAGLQSEFDTAEANSSMQRARTGDGNADLMGYIDEQLSAAGCYE